MTPLLSKPPDPTSRQNGQLRVLRVAADRFPVGQLRIADLQHPLLRHLADQLGWRQPPETSAVRAAHRELDHEIAFAWMTIFDLRAAIGHDPDVCLHRRGRRGNRRNLPRHHTQIGRRRRLRTRGSHLVYQRCELSVGERFVDYEQQVDVAARRDVAPKGERAMQDDPKG